MLYQCRVVPERLQYVQRDTHRDQNLTKRELAINTLIDASRTVNSSFDAEQYMGRSPYSVEARTVHHIVAKKGAGSTPKSPDKTPPDRVVLVGAQEPNPR